MPETIQSFLGTQIQQLSESVFSGEYGENNSIDIFEIEQRFKDTVTEAEFIIDNTEDEIEE